VLPSGVLRCDTPPARLRAVAFVEGWSYLVLLGVAMPLKYWAGMPIAVRVVGSLHGALFVALVVLTLRAMVVRGKPFGFGVRVAVASLLPFGTFFLDRELAADDERVRSQARFFPRPPDGSALADAVTAVERNVPDSVPASRRS
jgi:integral membrane protein